MWYEWSSIQQDIKPPTLYECLYIQHGIKPPTLYEWLFLDLATNATTTNNFNDIDNHLQL